ncbi:hypothetical protein [Phenylobacterium sp.]|jgi:hypothetical protein|uniref:hypothetical protein n=1 Tax=Phenylobacterium sp. TaxID=1871053 RepID=UPI002E35D4F8|nr:hypothetical protein [Phenylobacterium sp.]HEX3367436.1 hypothetical protein [Phenylobacterium sp.]
MTSRLLILVIAATALAASTAAPAAAQTSPAAVAKGYKAPRNAFGQPDLSGVWSNATITRLERDPKYGERLILTPAEANAIEGASDQRNARLRANTDTSIKDPDKLPECQSGAQGAACGYNAFWTDPGTRLVRIGGEARTSILTAPANGRLPSRPNVPAARARAQLGGNFDNPESRALGERCIVGFGGTSGPPMMPVLYNNHYQIQQTKDAVVVLVEMVHDARIIRVGGAHPPPGVRTWMGDSVGRWEGDTLVVETTNLRREQGLRGPEDNMKVVERFTRVSPEQILYQFEVVDPAAFAAPVKGEEALNFTKDKIYEYACHEGNYAMTGILAGARQAEKEGRPVEGNRGQVKEEGGN